MTRSAHLVCSEQRVTLPALVKQVLLLQRVAPSRDDVSAAKAVAAVLTADAGEIESLQTLILQELARCDADCRNSILAG